MAEQKNPQAQPELSLSEQTRIRREKLTNLQAEGQNPFVITASIPNAAAERKMAPMLVGFITFSSTAIRRDLAQISSTVGSGGRRMAQSIPRVR